MMAGRMEPTVRTGGRQAYSAAVTDLWERVGTALTRLERIAETPTDVLVEEHSDELPGLQYSLHAGAELAVGIEPPPAAEDLHEELVAALAEARDATAEVAYAMEIDEVEGVEPLLPEWRGSLFRVRLARLRALERTNALAAEAPPAPPEQRKPEHEGASWTAIAATVLILGGAFLFTAGACLSPGRCGPPASPSSPAASFSIAPSPRPNRAGRASPRGREARSTRRARARHSSP